MDDLHFLFRVAVGGTDSTALDAVATRPTTSAPFGTPVRVSAATGFVEAATFTPDGRAIYFHHNVGDRYQIERLAI